MANQVWNFSFTVPCALVMATLIAFYFSMRRLPIRINRTFLVLFTIQLLVMFFDVVSSLADGHYQSFSVASLYILNTLFFVFFLARIVCFYGFTLEILNIRDKRFIAATLLPFAIGEMLSISSFATGAVFWIEEGYHSGAFYNVLYGCFFFYIALSVILLAIHSKRLSNAELASAIGFNVVLLAGNVVRYLFPYLLAMNTFCMVAIVIIYLSFTNPDLYLSDDRRAFNMYGFHTIVRDWTGRRDYQVLGFVLRNYNYERSIIGGRQMDMAITAILEYLTASFPRALPFYLRNGRFALIGPATADWEAAQESIAKRFDSPWQTGETVLSFGVTFAHIASNAAGYHADEIGDNFIVALDESKENPTGGAFAGTYDPEHVNATARRIEVLRLLEKAVSEKKVEVFLQPLFESATNTMVAAEALARIRNDSGKLVSPELFIPVAEKSGLIAQLGDQVLETVCQFAHAHDLEALGLRWINVNLSPAQCFQQDIAERFTSILARYDLDPDFIHLEITEESMVDYELLQGRMLALQQAGFQFALDDYGSGYSNLTRVKRYPFVNIKIDREVIWDYCREPDCLLPALVSSFREMGLTVTAEGIETEEMHLSVVDMGCDYLQGFLYSQPLPTDEFVRAYGHAS